MLRLLLRLIFAFTLLTSRTGWAQPVETSAGPPVLALDEAIRTALKDNRPLQTSLLEASKAKEATAELGASRYPHFSTAVLSGLALNPFHVTIPAGTIGVLPGIGPLPAQDANITTPRRVTALVHASAAQPVSQLYKIGLGLRATRIGEELARENIRQKRQETAQQVRQAYYLIAQTQAQVAAAETSLGYLTELGALMERRLAEEAVLQPDVLSVRAKIGQQRYQLTTLRNDIDTQKEALNRLLGRDLATPFSVELLPLPAIEELDLAAARRTALEQRPEIRKARLAADKAELDIRRERAEYLPNFSLQLSYLSFLNISFAPRNATSAGFLFEWEPFDWGQKRHHIQQLRSTARQADLTRSDAGQQVEIEVGANYRKLSEARALLEALTTVQEAERAKLRVLMRRYEEHAALTADVLQQQTALAQADSQFSQALAGFWTARAAFHRALGEE